MSSYENHALVGGNEIFMKSLMNKFEDIDKQVYKFIEYWKHNVERFGSNVQWMPILLNHIYGKDRSLELIDQTGFNSLL